MPVAINKQCSRVSHYISAIVWIFVAFHSAAFSASPSDYKERVETAQNTVDGLLGGIDDLTTQVERDATGHIERSIPATERIDWSGGSVDTDNRWLGDQLMAFSRESGAEKRGAILATIRERLSAIHAAVEQLERASAADLTKDQDKQKLAEILRREEFQKPVTQEESLFQQWLTKFLDWVASVMPGVPTNSSSPTGPGIGSLGLQWLIYAALIAIIGFLIYKIAPFISRRFRSRGSEPPGQRVILGERIEADQAAGDLFGEAEQLASEGNPRGAIRKAYIAVLCDLSDRNVIRLARHKTNRDYLSDIRHHDRLFDNMRGLTGAFESNWYGLRTTERGDWDEFRARYLQTIASVKN